MCVRECMCACVNRESESFWYHAYTFLYNSYAFGDFVMIYNIEGLYSEERQL